MWSAVPLACFDISTSQPLKQAGQHYGRRDERRDRLMEMQGRIQKRSAYLFTDRRLRSKTKKERMREIERKKERKKE